MNATSDMAHHPISARLHIKARLRANAEHDGWRWGPVPPTPKIEHQRARALERHRARWEAVKAAKARGLPWNECK